MPQAQRRRGRPRSSTRTAVPAWRTDWWRVIRPARKPWPVTRVSARRTTGVRARTWSGTEAGEIPAASAKARPRAGSRVRWPICRPMSQLPVRSVPPYRPGVAPERERGPSEAVEARSVPAGVRGAGDGVAAVRAVESVKGAGPGSAAGWRRSSPPVPVPVPASSPRPGVPPRPVVPSQPERRSAADSTQARTEVPVGVRTSPSRSPRPAASRSSLLFASLTRVTQPEGWCTERDDVRRTKRRSARPWSGSPHPTTG